MILGCNNLYILWICSILRFPMTTDRTRSRRDDDWTEQRLNAISEQYGVSKESVSDELLRYALHNYESVAEQAGW